MIKIMQKGWYSSKCFKIIIYPKDNVSILRNIYTHFSQYFLPLKHAVASILTVVGTSHRKTLFKKKQTKSLHLSVRKIVIIKWNHTFYMSRLYRDQHSYHSISQEIVFM